MKMIFEKVKEEKGSSTIEFLGILPLALIVVMIMWQLIVSVQAVVVAQSAANEAAKVYSVTNDSTKAKAAAEKIVETGGSYLSFVSAPLSESNREFSTTVNVNIQFVFLPEKLFGGKTPSFSFSSDASGRVIQ